MADENEFDAEMESLDREDDFEDEDWRDEIDYALEYEEFDAVFSKPAAFDEIKDAKFQELRAAYLKASLELKAYIAIELTVQSPK